MRLAAIALIIVGNIFDYASTRFGLARGLQEINPIINALGLWQGKLFSAILCSLIALAIKEPRNALNFGLVGFGILVAVSIWNVYHAL